MTDAEWERIADEVLTQDEQRVRRVLAKGLPVKDVAAELNLSDDTVLHHVESMLVKLTRAMGGS